MTIQVWGRRNSINVQKVMWTLGALAFRYLTLDIERPALPNVMGWYARLCERAAYRRHVMIPFGRNASEWLEEERRNAGVQ